MNNYRKQFLTKYKDYYQSATKHIFDILKLNRSLKNSFSLALDTIDNDFLEIKNKTFPIDSEVYTELLNLFYNRLKFKLESSQYEILDEVLLQKYKSLIKKSRKENYLNFIDNLAKHEAYFNVKNNFKNYVNIYELMYEIGKFEGFDSFPIFEIKEYHRHYEGTEIFKELHKIFYRNEIKDEVSIVKVDTNNLKSSKIDSKKGFAENSKNTFLIENFNPCLRLLIEDRKFYNHLVTYDYIDGNKTSYDDFINVFGNNVENNISRIYFNCKTKIIAHLVSYITKEILKDFNCNFNLEHIYRSKSFYSINETLIKENILSTSKRNVLFSEELKLITLTIEFIKDYLLTQKKEAKC
jgi:hypothetical protein